MSGGVGRILPKFEPLSFHRTGSSHQANQRVQSFPGPSLCSGATAGWFQLRQLRRSLADEAYLWRPAHVHTCASLGRGQRRSCAQRLVKAVIGPLLGPVRCVESSNMTYTLNRLRYLGVSTICCCSFSPWKLYGQILNKDIISCLAEGLEQNSFLE